MSLNQSYPALNRTGDPAEAAENFHSDSESSDIDADAQGAETLEYRMDRLVEPDFKPIDLEPAHSETPNQYALVLVRHVQVAKRLVDHLLSSRSENQVRDIVLSYLDGYICWLPRKERAAFVSRVCPPENGSGSESPQLFLYIWRSLFTLCEQSAHSPNRVAQLFHREMLLGNKSTLFQLCSDPNISSNSLPVDEALFSSFVDGLKHIESGKINFDDMDECASAVKDITSAEKPAPKEKADADASQLEEGLPSKPDGGSEKGSDKATPMSWKKTFSEPEGLSAFIVSIRNYFSLIHYNAFVALFAWFWSLPNDTSLINFVWLDAALSGTSVLLDFLARLLVYGFSNRCCGFGRLTKRQGIPLTLIYPMYLAYLPVVYLFHEMLQPFALWVLAGAAAVKIIQNAMLYFWFSPVGKGNWLGDSTTLSRKLFEIMKLLCFFILLTSLLVPAHYLFIVPTLQRSAFWDFCSGFFATQRIQCYMGVGGLWVPMISIILIINYISFTIVLALYGALVANYKRLGPSSDESYSTIKGFRVLSNLLAGWKSQSSSPISDEVRANPFMDTGSFVGIVSPSLVEHDLQKVNKIWYHIVDDLRVSDIISSSDATRLYLAHNLHDVQLHHRAKEILLFFFSSIVGLPSERIAKMAKNERFLDDLPPMTQLIPSYGEAVVFDKAYLRNDEDKKLSNLQFLVLKYSREWENFHERMQQMFGDECPSSSAKLLDMFLDPNDILFPSLIDEVRLWASMRGQTLFRTVRGAFTYRMALRLLYENTNRDPNLASDRAQVILAHQQYGDPSVLRKIGMDIRLMMRKLSTPHFVGSAYGSAPFDLVFDWSAREIDKHEKNRDDLERRKQNNTAESDRLSIRLIHREVEEICEYGNTLKRLIEAKTDPGLLQRTSPFQFASVRASLPTCVRMHLVFVFKHRWGRAPSSSRKKSEFDSDSDSSDDLDDDTFSNGSSMYDPAVPNDKILSQSPWEFYSKGPLVLHREANSDGWLRFFDTQTAKESEFVLKPHLFDFKSIQYYDNRYMVLTLGIRTSQSKVESFALVAHVDTPGRVDDNLTNQEISYILNLISKKGKPQLEDFEPTNSVHTFERLQDWLSSYATEGCLNSEAYPASSKIHLGIEIFDVLPRVNPLLLRVQGELPFAEPERIQGKASNQLNGLKFTHGLVIQTKDANQGGSLAESIKYPLVLQRFMKQDGTLDPNAPVIIGFRESVFTRHISTVGRLQAYAEWAFGTIVQRVMSKLGVRMHYGHPDFFSAPWVYSRSGLSKANPTYNLSEDIFAGYVATLRQRKSAHTDRIQDEKGRDTSLSSTYTFTAKISQGAASQMKSRDIFELNTRLDFIRQFLTFQGSIGFYFSTALMLTSVKMYLVGLLLFTIAGFSAENLGNLGLIFSVPFLFQVGNFNLVPLVLEAYAEEGFWSVLQVLFDFPISLIYFLFQAQTTAYHFVESFLKGKSRYEATGRLLGLSRKSLIDFYQSFGRSHYEVAIDYTYYVLCYYIVADSRRGGYIPLIAPMITIIVFFLSPPMFQSGLSIKRVFAEVDSFGKWAFQSQTKDVMLKEWHRRFLSEAIGKKLTGNAAYKLGFSRLQSYNVFNNLKTEISSHWRVNLAAFLGNLVRLALWVFISLSIPGTMKDISMKVALLFLFYFTYSAVFNMTLGSRNEHRWQTLSLLMWLLVVILVIVQTILLGLWSWFSFSIVGMFVSMKVLNSFCWFCFQFYALFTKIHYARLWNSASANLASNAITKRLHDEKAERYKVGLEQQLLSGLYLLDRLERPFLLLGIFVFLMPCHLLINLIWQLPGLSDRLAYGLRLGRKKQRSSAGGEVIPGMRFRGFNMASGLVDIDDVSNEDIPAAEDWQSL